MHGQGKTELEEVELGDWGCDLSLLGFNDEFNE